MGDLCEEIQKMGKGIGNACRYTLLESLMKGPKTVSELTGAVDMSQPAVSQHLKVLKSCGLVSDEKQGQVVYYSLNTEYMLEMLNALASNVIKNKKSQNKKEIR